MSTCGMLLILWRGFWQERKASVGLVVKSCGRLDSFIVVLILLTFTICDRSFPIYWHGRCQSVGYGAFVRDGFGPTQCHELSSCKLAHTHTHSPKLICIVCRVPSRLFLIHLRVPLDMIRWYWMPAGGNGVNMLCSWLTARATTESLDHIFLHTFLLTICFYACAESVLQNCHHPWGILRTCDCGQNFVGYVRG